MSRGAGGVPSDVLGAGSGPDARGALGAARRCCPIGREELGERLGQLGALDAAVAVDDQPSEEALVDLLLDEVGCGFVVPVAVAGDGQGVFEGLLAAGEVGVDGLDFSQAGTCPPPQHAAPPKTPADLGR